MEHGDVQHQCSAYLTRGPASQPDHANPHKHASRAPSYCSRPNATLAQAQGESWRRRQHLLVRIVSGTFAFLSCLLPLRDWHWHWQLALAK